MARPVGIGAQSRLLLSGNSLHILGRVRGRHRPYRLQPHRLELYICPDHFRRGSGEGRGRHHHPDGEQHLYGRHHHQCRCAHSRQWRRIRLHPRQCGRQRHFRGEPLRHLHVRRRDLGDRRVPAERARHHAPTPTRARPASMPARCRQALWARSLAARHALYLGERETFEDTLRFLLRRRKQRESESRPPAQARLRWSDGLRVAQPSSSPAVPRACVVTRWKFVLFCSRKIVLDRIR
jgi:hypothetical protein